jgi:outer membrane lipoprotein-sorting protein
MSKNWIRWIPAIAVPAAVVVAGAVVVPMAAGAAPNLPAKTPAEVLSLLASSDVDAYSGEVTVTSDLGLPSVSSIPGAGSTGSGRGGSSDDGTDAASSVLELLTGSHDLRVYRDGSDARMQVLDQLAERDVVVNGGGKSPEAWLYDSDENSVVHVTGTAPEHAAPETSMTPDELAATIVDELEPSSSLSVDSAQRVASRDAYTLVLEPKATDTLVGDVSIAVDAETGMPLRVSATARGAGDPALEVAFTSIDFAAPSADLFDFTAPKDAEVTEESLDDIQKPDASTAEGTDVPKATVTGEGWDAIATLDTGSDATDMTDLTESPLFTQLATRVDGGYLLHTSLVNVLLTDDGRVLAGSVPADALSAAAK